LPAGSLLREVLTKSPTKDSLREMLWGKGVRWNVQEKETVRFLIDCGGVQQPCGGKKELRLGRRGRLTENLAQGFSR